VDEERLCGYSLQANVTAVTEGDATEAGTALRSVLLTTYYLYQYPVEEGEIGGQNIKNSKEEKGAKDFCRKNVTKVIIWDTYECLDYWITLRRILKEQNLGM
jgi:hypothetical protein